MADTIVQLFEPYSSVVLNPPRRHLIGTAQTRAQHVFIDEYQTVVCTFGVGWCILIEPDSKLDVALYLLGEML
jgi:hypothetical protein